MSTASAHWERVDDGLEMTADRRHVATVATMVWDHNVTVDTVRESWRLASGTTWADSPSVRVSVGREVFDLAPEQARALAAALIAGAQTADGQR